MEKGLFPIPESDNLLLMEITFLTVKIISIKLSCISVAYSRHDMCTDFQPFLYCLLRCDYTDAPFLINLLILQKDTDRKLIAFTVASCVAVGAVLAVLAPLFPMMYNTTDSVRTLATWFIRIVAVYIPVCAFLNACYFTLRAGGRISGVPFTNIFDTRLPGI